MGTVLLVNTDPDTRDRWSSAISLAGHEVVLAVAITEASARLREGGIDAVVIDSYDPRVGVVELARSIESLPDAPPVVLVSGSPHAPEISVRIGAAAFVPKPCDPAELVSAVGRLLGEVRPVKVVDDGVVDEIEDEPTGPKRPSAERISS